MDNDKRCGMLFKQINDEFQKRANNQMRSQDITMSQSVVLINLSHAPSFTLSMKELEKLLYIAQPTVVGVVNRLEQKGMIESFSDPRDKRVKLVRLTESGNGRVRQIEESMFKVEKSMMSELTETELDILYTLLKKVHNSLK